MDLFQLMLWKPWFCIYSMFSITPLRDHLRWVGSLSIPFQVVLVLIFHLRTFALRLQVLYRFLEFFSKFDWDNLCVGLWGPVPIRSLPDMKGTMVFLLSYLIYFLIEWRNDFFAVIGSEFFFPFKYLAADPPRKDGGELLLSKLFLDACTSVYSAFPIGQENHELPFMSKHFNVIDPLRANNNLGRSVSKGTYIAQSGCSAVSRFS